MHTIPFEIKMTFHFLRKVIPPKNSSGGGARTPDTRIMIPLLYQLSYTAKTSREKCNQILPESQEFLDST
jgi:hypothetical protein